MGTVHTLALSLGSAWVSGINLYATVFTLGLLGRFGAVELPGGLETLTNWWVIVTSFLLYSIEFFADKIPYLDSIWDVVHTFIRIPAGAVMAAAAWGDAGSAIEVIAFMVGGGLAAGSHATKASSRLAINMSPEPFSNIGASLLEDVIAVGTVCLGYFAPIIMLLLLLMMVAVAALILPRAWRGAMAVRAKLCAKRKAASEDRQVPLTASPAAELDPKPKKSWSFAGAIEALCENALEALLIVFGP